MKFVVFGAIYYVESLSHKWSAADVFFCKVDRGGDEIYFVS